MRTAILLLALVATGCQPDRSEGVERPRQTIDRVLERADSMDARTLEQNRQMDALLREVDETPDGGGS